jgi:hypothetical protein
MLSESADARPSTLCLSASSEGSFGQNFLRFCDPASRRKPVVCRPWQTPLGACASPCFSRPGPQARVPTCGLGEAVSSGAP